MVFNDAGFVVVVEHSLRTSFLHREVSFCGVQVLLENGCKCLVFFVGIFSSDVRSADLRSSILRLI